MLELPDAPKEIFASKYNEQETQVLNEGNPIFFVDEQGHPPKGVEYPPEGGILVYKYGGIIEPLQIDPQKYEAIGQQVLKELNELLNKYDHCLMGQDRQPAMLIPNEIVKLENTKEVKDRVDLLYPEKGFPDPLAISLANKVKRVLKISIDFFSYKWTMVAFFPFIFLPFKLKIKIIEKWLDGWSGFGKLTMEPRLMQPRYYRAFCRELLKFIDTFLKDLGISNEVAEKTAWVIAEMAERDNSYVWRAEDLASETSKEKMLKDFRGEIKKLVKILNKRELMSKKLGKTAESISKVLCGLTYIPRIKKSLDKSLRECNFKNFQLDDIDRYHTSRLAGYDFNGIPYEVRYQAYINMHNGNIPKHLYYKYESI